MAKKNKSSVRRFFRPGNIIVWIIAIVWFIFTVFPVWWMFNVVFTDPGQPISLNPRLILLP